MEGQSSKMATQELRCSLEMALRIWEKFLTKKLPVVLQLKQT